MKIDTETFNNLCYEVKEATKNNEHTISRMLVAKYFNLKHFIKVFEFIDYMHIREGFMDKDLNSIRTREHERMMLKVKDILSNNPLDVFLFDKLNNCF